MNPFDLLKNLNINDINKKTEEILHQLQNETVTGEAGGGFVRVTINGNFQILSIEYEDNDIITEDLKTFRDLVIVAQNSAVTQMKEIIKTKFSSSMLPGIL